MLSINQELPKISIVIHILLKLYFGLMGWVFANGPGDQASIPGQVIPKTQKMVLDATNFVEFVFVLNIIQILKIEFFFPS